MKFSVYLNRRVFVMKDSDQPSNLGCLIRVFAGNLQGGQDSKASSGGHQILWSLWAISSESSPVFIGICFVCRAEIVYGNRDTFRRDNRSKLFCLPPGKGFSLKKERICSLLAASYLLLGKTSSQKETGMQKHKQKVEQLSPFLTLSPTSFWHGLFHL